MERCACGLFHHSEATTGNQVRRGEQPWPLLPAVQVVEVLQLSPLDFASLCSASDALATVVASPDRSSSAEQPPPPHHA